MADTVSSVAQSREGVSVGLDDVAGVRSRVSWPAVLAGSVLTLALYFLLTLLGSAIGFSVSDKFEGRNIGLGAAAFAIVVTTGCLFAGGFVASQLTAGENKREGAMYGLFVWAAVFIMLLWLMATGVKAGFNTMVGVATAGSAAVDTTAKNVTQADTEEAARRMGFTQQQIDEAKQKVKNAPADAKAAAEDPANKAKAQEIAREAGEVATRVTWWTFLGTLLSMLAAVAGGFVGAGPSFRLFAVPVARHTFDRREAVVH